MLSDSNPPFDTKLTFFASKNDFYCMTTANDLRKPHEIGSILGLAVMLKKPSWEGEMFEKC